jgi:tetratricopeptide (TPR) repeat protein
MATDPTSLADEARRLHGLGRHDEAVDTLRRALAASPGDYAARELLVRSLLDLGAPEDARGEAEALVRTFPGQPEPLRLLGDALFRLGRVAEASEALTRAESFADGPGAGTGSSPRLLDWSPGSVAFGDDDDLEGEPTRIHGAHSEPSATLTAPPQPPAGSLSPPSLRPSGLDPQMLFASGGGLDEPAPPPLADTPLTPVTIPGGDRLVPAPTPDPSVPPASGSIRSPGSPSSLPLGLPSRAPLGSPSAAPLGSPLSGLPGAIPGRDPSAAGGSIPAGGAASSLRTDAPSGDGRPRRGFVAALAVTLVLAGAAASAAALGLIPSLPWSSRLEPEQLAMVDAAARDGSLDAMVGAVDVLSGVPGARELRSALLAAVLYEHREGDLRTAASGLPDVGGGVDASLARIHLALAQNDPDKAWAQAEALPPAPPDRPDLASRIPAARAAAALAAGRPQEAAALLETRSDLVSRSPRLAALFARSVAAIRDPAAGRAALPAEARTPGARLVRAELAVAGGEVLEETRAELQALVEDPATSAAERARASLALAEEARLRGATAEAERQALAAWSFSSAAPLVGYPARLARVLVDVGAGPALVAPVLERVPADPSTLALRFDAALAAGELDRAGEVLGEAGSGAPDPERLLRRGLLAEARGDARGAQRAYDELAEVEGWRATARTRLAALAVSTGRGDAAQAFLEEAVTADPAHPEAVPLLVEARLEEGDAAAALEVARAATDERPTLLPLRRALGQALLARGELDEALATLRPVAGERPQDVEAQMAFAAAARRRGLLDEADAALQRALEAQPRFGPALAARFDVAYARRDEALLEATLDAVRSAGTLPALRASMEARLAVFRGLGAAALGKSQTEAERHPSAELSAAVGFLSLQAGDPVSAGRWFERAAAQDPSLPEPQVGLARVRILRGDVGTAARSLGEAERLAELVGRDEELALEFILARAWVHFQVGNLMDADREGRRAVQRDPEDGRAHHIVALVVLARAEDAREHLRQAVAGHHPPPEALALWAVRAPDDQACALAAKARARGPTLEATRRLGSLSCD